MTDEFISTADRLRQEGEKRGIAKGEKRGIATGERLGAAQVLLRQLELRFGPMPSEVVDRIDAASIEQVLTWSAAVLDADSAAAVFDD